MRQIYRLLWLGVLMLSSGLSSAAPLAVTPQPHDCKITGSQSSLDFGKRNRSGLEMNSRGKLTPGQRAIRISVLCRFPRKIVLDITGNAAGRQFIWGNAGEVRIEVQEAELDNRPVLLSRLQRDGLALVGSAPVLTLSPGDYFTPSTSAGQITGKQLTFTLIAEPELDDRRLKLDQPYNGQSLLTIHLK